MRITIELLSAFDTIACQTFKATADIDETRKSNHETKPYPLFEMGKIEISDSVLRKVSLFSLCDALARYQQGDWGDATEIESDYNDLAIPADDEIFARYCYGDATLTTTIDDLRQVTNVYSCEEY